MTDTSRTSNTGMASDSTSLSASAAPWLTPSATAARSMRAIGRITDTDERREAFARHMAQFPPLIGRL